MSGPDWYVTQAMQTVIETRPVAAALEDWIRLAAKGAPREARTVEALAIVDRLGKFMCAEGEAAEDMPRTVVGIFERGGRSGWHPSMGRQSAEAQELATEEHCHDVAMGRYYDSDGA